MTAPAQSEREFIRDLPNATGRVVKVSGWVTTLRLQRAMQFVVIRDRTGDVQVTNEREANPQLAEQIDALTPGSAVTFVGLVVENERVRLGGIEVLPERVEGVSIAEQPLPIAANSNIDARLDWRFLDLREPAHNLVFEITDALENHMRAFLRSAGFREIHTPKLMGAASESGAEVFKVKYFDANAFLAQSPQFYKQMAIAAGFDRVLEVGPVFRAEPSYTSRHSTEFTGVDFEMAWIDSVDDVMTVEENMLADAIGRCAEEYGDRIAAAFSTEVVVPETPFPRVTMREAHEWLGLAGWKHGAARGDLDAEGERLLSEIVKDKFGHEFVFVTEYPIDIRPFYHMRSDDDPGVTFSFDLLWKGLEVTTGAQREHRYEILHRQALEKGINPEGIEDYMNAFRYGCPPHGGLGLGLNRLVMRMLDQPSIRETSMFFRGPNRLRP